MRASRLFRKQYFLIFSKVLRKQCRSKDIQPAKRKEVVRSGNLALYMQDMQVSR